MNTGTSVQIHPSAVVENGARLGSACVIHAYAFVSRHSDLGEGVVVHPFAAVGGEPQDLGFDPATASRVLVGARTVIREHVTINRATKAGAATTVGADCFLMTASHVAHDCVVGDRVVIANAVLLGGHVQVGDRAFLGGGAVVHQGCRIGESVMLGGGARISNDVAPYCMATERNALIGLNIVGLRRRGFGRDVMRELKLAFRCLDAPVGNLRDLATVALQREDFTTAQARHFLEFFRSGRRGFVRTRKTQGSVDGSDGE